VMYVIQYYHLSIANIVLVFYMWSEVYFVRTENPKLLEVIPMTLEL
jgi:hypothetical protein